MCDRFSNFLEFDKKQNEYANIVEECEEISMWNLHKDMSFAAKRKHSERKIEGSIPDSLHWGVKKISAAAVRWGWLYMKTDPRNFSA